MNSASLHQNFISFVENATKEKSNNESQCYRIPAKNADRFCCDKCRFTSKDFHLFERHVAQHAVMTFSCSYCNHVSYTKVESQRHSVQHTGSFPFKCQFCRYGAVRRDYIVKHIQRVHRLHQKNMPPEDGNHTVTTGKVPILSPSACPSGPKLSMDVSSRIHTTVGPSISNSSYVIPHTSQSIGNASFGIPKTLSQSIGNASSGIPKTSQYIGSSSHRIPDTVSQSIRNASSEIPQTTSQSIGNASYVIPQTSHSVGNSSFGITNTGSHSIGNAYGIPKTTSQSIGNASYKIPNTVSQLTGNESYRIPSTVSQSIGNAIDDMKRVGRNKHAENTSQPGAFPKVQVGLLTEKTIQQKTLPTVHVGWLTEKTIQPRILSNVQVGQLAEKNVQPRTLPQVEMGKLVEKTIHPMTMPNVQVGQLAEKTIQRRIFPKVQVGPSVQKNIQPRTLPQVEVGLAEKTRPNILSKVRVRQLAEKTIQPRTLPKVQVELLAPLNEPIQHNRPLTVSYPEEMNIPPGCLVELVEVKTVNGTRELELRLVPQQSVMSQDKNLTGKTTVGTLPDKSSFTCKVTSDGERTKNAVMTCTVERPPQGINLNSLNTNSLSVPHDHRVHLQKQYKEISVTVKEEPEENETVFYRKTGLSQSSVKLNRDCQSLKSPPLYNSVSTSNQESIVHPSESLSAHKVHHPFALCKASAKEPSHPTFQPPTPRIIIKRNLKGDGLITELRASAITHPDRHDNDTVEGEAFGLQGLPVISSVFSLCPLPEGFGLFPQPKEGPLHNVAMDKNEPPTIQQEGSAKKPLFLFHNKDTAEKISDKELQNRKDSLVTRHGWRVAENTGDLFEKATEAVLTRLEYTTKAEGLSEEPNDLFGSGQTKIVTERSEDNPGGVNQNLTEFLKEETIPDLNNFQKERQESVSSHQNVSLLNMNKTTPRRAEKTPPRTLTNLTSQTSCWQSFSLNPKVALIRIPNLECQPPPTSTKSAQQKPMAEESVTARPVLFCKQNVSNQPPSSQDTVLRLILKRKRSETENKNLSQDCEAPDPLPSLTQDHMQHSPRHKRSKKDKKRTKKHKSSKAMVVSHGMDIKGDMGQLWLTPLKEDQLIKRPGPNQPVVVLNHPNPQSPMVSTGVQTMKDYKWIASMHNIPSGGITKTSPEMVEIYPSLKMKLKKVQGHKYEVTELVLKGH